MLKSNSDRVKNQLYILIAAFCLAFLPVISLSLVPYIFFFSDRHVPFYYSLLSVVIFPLAVTYMLTSQEIIDIRLKFKEIILQIGVFLLSLLLADSLFVLFFPHHLYLFSQINILFFAVTLIVYGTNQFFSSRSYRHLSNRAQAIAREKHLIMQQVLNGQHLRSCARLITRLIHKTVDVSGVCLIWKQNEIPKILHQTGIFADDGLALDLFRVVNVKTTEEIQKQWNVLVFPLCTTDNTRGWIFLGQKTNGTRFEKNEHALIKNICIDAIDLLSNSEVLAEMDSKLEKTRDESYSHEQFNRLLMNSIDENQRNLSIFLHDDILQNVILLENRIVSLHDSAKIDEAAYREIKELLMNTIYDIREKSHELHPFIVEDLGLAKSVQSLKKKLQKNYNVIIDTSYDLGMTIIPKKVELAAFRMIKELVYNSIKHALSPVVTVSLKCVDRYLAITVSDRGKGFDFQQALCASSGHIGLFSVQKTVALMNGLCDIHSSPVQGTTINITLPLDWNEDHGHKHRLSR